MRLPGSPDDGNTEVAGIPQREPLMNVDRVVAGQFTAPGSALASVVALHRGGFPMSGVSFFSLSMQPAGDLPGYGVGNTPQGVGRTFDASAWWEGFFEAVMGQWLTPARALQYEAVLQSGQYLVMAQAQESLATVACQILEGQGALNVETVAVSRTPPRVLSA